MWKCIDIQSPQPVKYKIVDRPSLRKWPRETQVRISWRHSTFSCTWQQRRKINNHVEICIGPSENMTSVTARRNQGKLAEKIYRETHCELFDVYFFRCLCRWRQFNWILFLWNSVRKDDVIELLQWYLHYLVDTDRMDRTKFREILHNHFKLTDDILMDRGRIDFAERLYSAP